MKRIFKCNICNKYTMKEICGCGNKTLLAKPVKFTPNDRLGSYKRKAKIGDYTERGLV